MLVNEVCSMLHKIWYRRNMLSNGHILKGTNGTYREEWINPTFEKNTSVNTFNTRTDMAEDRLHGMAWKMCETKMSGLMSGSNPSKWPRPVKSSPLRRQREHWVKCKAKSGTRRSEAGLGLYPRVATLPICSHLLLDPLSQVLMALVFLLYHVVSQTTALIPLDATDRRRKLFISSTLFI